MKKQVYNPYLPSWEYVPDGEPHVFGDRVYVYGSHDRFGHPMFCVNDYVCWSAPVKDLSDWTCEGVIYKKTQHPGNPFGIRSLYAPDVALWPDLSILTLYRQSIGLYWSFVAMPKERYRYRWIRSLVHWRPGYQWKVLEEGSADTPADCPCLRQRDSRSISGMWVREP